MSGPQADPLRDFLADRDVHCPHCRYNLRGCDLRSCPECGGRLDLTLAERPRDALPWRVLVAVAIVVVVDHAASAVSWGLMLAQNGWWWGWSGWTWWVSFVGSIGVGAALFVGLLLAARERRVRPSRATVLLIAWLVGILLLNACWNLVLLMSRL